MGAAGNGRATRQRGVQEIVQARGVVTIPTPYELTNLQTYELTLRVRASHFAENGGYPPTQNGDIRSLFWLFSLMALQN